MWCPIRRGGKVTCRPCACHLGQSRFLFLHRLAAEGQDEIGGLLACAAAWQTNFGIVFHLLEPGLQVTGVIRQILGGWQPKLGGDVAAPKLGHAVPERRSCFPACCGRSSSGSDAHCGGPTREKPFRSIPRRELVAVRHGDVVARAGRSRPGCHRADVGPRGCDGPSAFSYRAWTSLVSSGALPTRKWSKWSPSPDRC